MNTMRRECWTLLVPRHPIIHRDDGAKGSRTGSLDRSDVCKSLTKPKRLWRNTSKTLLHSVQTGTGAFRNHPLIKWIHGTSFQTCYTGYKSDLCLAVAGCSLFQMFDQSPLQVFSHWLLYRQHPTKWSNQLYVSKRTHHSQDEYHKTLQLHTHTKYRYRFGFDLVRSRYSNVAIEHIYYLGTVSSMKFAFI